MTLADRLAVVRRARELAASRAEELARASGEPRGRPVAEVLTSEVLPLLEAMRFLEKNAPRLLRPVALGMRGRPLWLSAVRAEIRRAPFGTVLVIGPGNYPLFLPGVQTLQALAAGNRVLLKPGVDGTRAVTLLREILLAAGLPAERLTILDEAPARATEAIAAGVDLVVLTGASETGRVILRAAAETLTPVIAELSGCDAMWVRDDADVALAMSALRFGQTLNGGATCIAPRRILVAPRHAAAFPPEAVAVESDDAALVQIAACPQALGVSIFTSDVARARELAERIIAGVVTINDVIFPTADPRAPFGGRRASGFGVTRGAEGLLAMTAPQVVTVTRGKMRRHYEPAAGPAEAALFTSYIAFRHGSRRDRWTACRRMCEAVKALRRENS